MIAFAPALRVHRMDAALSIVGAAIGLPSLMFPFGWDTSVHYYVGREWALRGAVPYRDTFDHKPPGIHLVHAACVTLFGERMWPIRLVELVCVVAIGVMSAELMEGARAPSSPRGPGLRGLGVFVSSVFVYGFFDFGNSAQCELVATALVVASVLCARRGWPLAAGVLAASSALTKPSLLLLLVPWMVWRAGSFAVRSFSRFTLGAVIVIVGALSYFAAHGALVALFECVVGANALYVSSEGPVLSAATILGIGAEHFRHFSPVSTVLVVLLLVGGLLVRTGDGQRRTRWGLAGVLTLAPIVTVFVQRKFFPYHWSPVVVGISATAIAFALEAPPRARSWVVAGVAATFTLAFTQTGPQYRVWRATVAVAADRALGRIDEEAFARHFVAMPGGSRWADARQVGLFLRARAAPDDLLAMRGVSAEIYAVSGCSAPSRFFWTSFLTSPTRAYHRDAWLAEDASALLERRPRWLVVPATAPIASSEATLLHEDEFSRTRIGNFFVYERSPKSRQERASLK